MTMQCRCNTCALCLSRFCASPSTFAWGTPYMTTWRTCCSTPSCLLPSTTREICSTATRALPLLPRDQRWGGHAAVLCPARTVSSSPSSASHPPYRSSGQKGSSDNNGGDNSGPGASPQSPAASMDLTNVATPRSTIPLASSSASSERIDKVRNGESGRRTPQSGAASRGSSSVGAPGKSKHSPGSPGPQLKVKKRAPWGVQQLRDSWSEDAMSKRDRENMDERIHREYRYHPDEFRRHYIRYTAMLTIPCIILGMSITYYRETGRPVWTADPQHLLNLLRVMDTSPRSKLYAYRLEETTELPPHVLAYREQHAGKREYDERVFRLTHSAFERPDGDALRQLELEEQLKAIEASHADEAELMEKAGIIVSDENVALK